MNDNTILRIKVPAHLYESVKEQLTLTEAKKAGHNYGSGMEVVKEKKMKAPKDGMKKVEEGLRDGMYNDFTKWKESFPEDTEFKEENGYMMAKDKEGKELGKWNPSSMLGSHADDFHYKSLEEMPAKKDRSLEELMKAKEKLESKINEMEMASKDKVNEAGAGVGYAWIPATLAGLGISGSIIKGIISYMKKNNLKGMKGFMQAYKEIGGDAKSTIGSKMTGGMEEAKHEKKEVNELFGLGAKIEVRDKADVKKMVKVGSGDYVIYKPNFDATGYARDGAGTYIIDKIKDGKVILKKAGKEYQAYSDDQSRDVSGLNVDPSSLAYWGKK